MIRIAVFLTLLFPLLCIRVTMAVNDAVLSSRSDNWVVAALVFQGITLALLWTSILTK